MKAFHSPRLGPILLLALAVAEWSQASQPTNTPLAVMTVTGPVAIGELGLVLAHEHVMSTCWAEPAAGPTLRRCGGHRGLLSHDGNLHPAPGARPRPLDWLLPRRARRPQRCRLHPGRLAPHDGGPAVAYAIRVRVRQSRSPLRASANTTPVTKNQ